MSSLLRYPIFIISKGRSDSRLTVKSFEKIKVPYRIVVEPQEYDKYSSVIPRTNILILPFSNLGQGSIPARNWVWDYATKEGYTRHWIVDDNIDGFFRFNKNLKVPVGDGTIFRAMEDFTDRYENVPMSGPNYFMFVPRKSGDIKPFTSNTRVYSCILLSNKVPHRWRGRYNEDTDLSIRFLKDGYSTILFNAFLAMKSTTLTMKGGNTDELYKKNDSFDGRLEMARSLLEQHPDIVKITRKWDRWQHHVDYSSFKNNKLILKTDLNLSSEINNYNMILKPRA